jgi:hypothetical protein
VKAGLFRQDFGVTLAVVAQIKNGLDADRSQLAITIASWLRATINVIIHFPEVFDGHGRINLSRFLFGARARKGCQRCAACDYRD